MRKLKMAAVAVMAAGWIGFISLPAVAADADPSMHQIYETAESGHLGQAQDMISQVLRDHPRSAKAHYVQAELYARAGKIASARTELGRAEELQPGLGFAKPAAVQALRSELAVGGSNVAARGESGVTGYRGESHRAGVPWGLLILIALVLGAIWSFLRRRQPGPATAGGPYASGGYGVPPAGPMGGGLGSGLAGGLASGLALGAGVVAGEELAHHLLDGGRRESVIVPPEHDGTDGRDANADLGGNDFGVNDAGSWDDGGSSGGGGGDDWT